MNQVKEEAKKLYVENEMYGDVDYSQYPHIEVESILSNAEYNEIIVNMRHWKTKEAADYYRQFINEEDLIAALANEESIPCYPSEVRLSVKDNMLQIEEMKYGEKKTNGTEFSPLYPD